MKKIYKIMVFVLMFALAIGSAIVAPITVFATGPALVGATILLSKMPTTGMLNKDIIIPKGKTTTSGSQVTVEVKDPFGKAVELADYDENNKKFTAKYKGDYTVVYTASSTGSNSQTKSEVYTIRVTGAKAELTFAENTPFLFPSKVGANTTLVLPYPTVSVDGEDVESATVSVKVTDPKHNVWTAGTLIDGYTNPIAKKTIDGVEYYTFTSTKAGEREAVFGTYSILYSYTNSDVGTIPKSFNVTVSPNYSVEKQKVTYTWNGSMPESAVLGKEVKLPKPVTVDANANNASVQTYTQVSVTYHDGQQTKKYDVEDFKFTPMDIAKSGSYYTIDYKIYTLEQLNLANNSTLEDALANATGVLTKTYKLSNVTDTAKPEPQVVESYVVGDDGKLEQDVIDALDGQDVSYLIPTQASTQKAIEIPAIYATDNYDTFENLTLSRTLIDESGNSYSLDGEGTLNDEITNNNPTIVRASTNNVATVTFKLKGTYSVRYRAQDKAGNNKDVTYKIVVKDGLVDTNAPTITLPTITSFVNPGDEVSFAEPTIIDYATDSSSQITIDSNIKKNVYYYYADAEATALTDFETMRENGQLKEVSKNEDDNTKYSLTVDKETENKYLIILVRAEDDAKYSAGQNQNNVSYKYKNVTIYNTSDDVVPTLEGDLSALASQLEASIGQNQEVKLAQSIKFKDSDKASAGQDTTKYLTSTLKVYDSNGNEIKVSGVQYTYDGEYFSINNGKFVTTIAGTYKIVITTSDMGGNYLINSLQFTVDDTKAPVIESDFNITTMELGKGYEIPEPTVIDDGVEIENQADTIVEFGDNNPSYLWNGKVFTPKEAGTYTFRYHAKDSEGNDAYSDYYTIIVTDTTKPVITLNTTGEYTAVPETAPYKDANGDVLTVKIPLYTASDEYNGIKSHGVKVTDADGDELLVSEGADFYEFTPNGNGIYTVQYSAIDYADLETVLEYKIKVGDVTAPTIVLDSTNIPKNYKIGDTISIQLDNITLQDIVDGEIIGTDAVSTTDSAKSKLAIKLTGPDGASVSFTKNDDIWSYEFKNAGTYTLTYTVTDSAGNSDDAVYTFEVASKSDSLTISETTWGIVLTVVAIAMLAGVVIYFVKTKDAPADKTKKAKDKESK